MPTKNSNNDQLWPEGRNARGETRLRGPEVLVIEFFRGGPRGGGQLYFTLPSAPDPFFKASKAPECTKLARFSAAAAAVFTLPQESRAFEAPRCAISSAKKIASEPRFLLRRQCHSVLQGARQRGRQLYFTLPSAPDPLFKASKAPFLTLRVATPSGAPRQAPLDNG